MRFVCRRCGNSIRHKIYRVTTQEAGVVLLNMLVCSACARIAKDLGLPVMHVQTIRKEADAKTAKAKTGKRVPLQAASVVH